MTTKEIDIETNDKFDNVIIVLGIIIMADILSSSLGIDMSDTFKHMASSIVMIVN